LVLGRGPLELDDEIELMERFAIDLLVSKASGGSATEAKIEAARTLGIPVVMVKRPAVSAAGAP
jgi:precorrin-6A/cobalt-precorrin-6A reductase